MSMRKLHEWRAAQSLDRGLTGSLLCPHAKDTSGAVREFQDMAGAVPRSGEFFVTFAGDFGGPPEAYAR
jgi:hypothetical protein